MQPTSYSLREDRCFIVVRVRSHFLLSIFDALTSTVPVVQCDPPRKGLERELLDVLVSEPSGPLLCEAHTLIYLSCGFHSFENDLQILTAHGRWECIHLQFLQFFPGSNHLEGLAVLRKARDHICNHL